MLQPTWLWDYYLTRTLGNKKVAVTCSKKLELIGQLFLWKQFTSSLETQQFFIYSWLRRQDRSSQLGCFCRGAISGYSHQGVGSCAWYFMYTLSASIAVPAEGHTHDINMCRGPGSLDMAMLILFCSNTTSVVRLIEERCARVLITENNSQLVPVFIPFYVCVCLCVRVCVCVNMCAKARMCMSGDSFLKCPRAWAQVTKLGGKNLQLLYHLSGCLCQFIRDSSIFYKRREILLRMCKVGKMCILCEWKLSGTFPVPVWVSING